MPARNKADARYRPRHHARERIAPHQRPDEPTGLVFAHEHSVQFGDTVAFHAGLDITLAAPPVRRESLSTPPPASAGE